MNKWLVLGIVVMLVLLVTLKIISRDGVYQNQVSQEIQKEPLGVSLSSASKVTAETIEGDYGSEFIPLGNIEDGCEDRSLDKLRPLYNEFRNSDYDGGEAAKFEIYNAERDADTYKLAIRYFACQAAASRDISGCGLEMNKFLGWPLKGGFGRAEGSEDVDFSANGVCKSLASRVMFAAYMAGIYKNKTSCQSFIKSRFMDMEDLPIPISDFCDIASGGMENICKTISKHLPSDKLCLGTFPRNKADCENSKFCLNTLKIYKAIKNAKPEDCPNEYKEICKAFIKRNNKICAPIANKLNRLHCGNLKAYRKYLNKVEKDKKAEEKKRKLQETLKNKERQRKFEKEYKIEKEKEIKEINKRVRKLLGKE